VSHGAGDEPADLAVQLLAVHVPRLFLLKSKLGVPIRVRRREPNDASDSASNGIFTRANGNGGDPHLRGDEARQKDENREDDLGDTHGVPSFW